MRRPFAVAILAILHWLEAALLLLLAGLLAWWMRVAAELGGAAIAPPEVPTETLELLNRLSNPSMMGAAVIVLGAVAAVFAAAGVGLWKLRNWARLVTLGLTALRLLLLLPGLLLTLARSDLLGLGVELLFVLVYAWILWYLYQPHVKQAFGAA